VLEWRRSISAAISTCRASHRIRWLWASHSVHHSAEQMTLLASLRLGWTNLFSAGWVFYVPLIFAGFPPFVLVALLPLVREQGRALPPSPRGSRVAEPAPGGVEQRGLRALEGR